jgi:hypothetical protein
MTRLDEIPSPRADVPPPPKITPLAKSRGVVEGSLNLWLACMHECNIDVSPVGYRLEGLQIRFFDKIE